MGGDMVQIITILVSIGAIITAFFSRVIPWIILPVPASIFLLMYISLKQKKWEHIPELSDTANTMLQKYGHYYAMPLAGRDFSASCSTIMFAGAGVAIIEIFKGFYWGIAIAAINWIALALIAKAFNPSQFIEDPIEKLTHDEIIEYVLNKKKDKVGDT
jgi:hypothetical protein